MRTTPRFTLCVLMLGLVLPAFASAQTTSKWSLEFYAGAITEAQSKSGTAIGEFPVGDSFVTAAGHESRFHSSWRFGDGAQLFNQVAAQFAQIEGRAFETIVPLDTALRSSGGRSSARPVFGLRLGRTLTPTVSLEILIERSSGGLTITDEMSAVINAANDSFEPAFTDLLSTAPISTLSAASTFVMSGNTQSQTRLIAAISKLLLKRQQWSVSGLAGGGVQLRGGEAAEARVTGHYTFNLFGIGPFAERDDVTISFGETAAAALGLIGVDAVYDFSPGSGLRLGARLHLTANQATTTIVTDPAVTIATLPSVLPTNTSPGLQFSNQAAPLSSLRPSLATTLPTFTGSGMNRQFVVTLGWVRRF